MNSDNREKFFDLPQDMRNAILRRVILITMGAITASVAITFLVSYLMGGYFIADGVGLVVAIVAPALIAPCASFVQVSLSVRLKHANERLKALSETDSLTSTYNRRRFMELASQALSLASRHGYPTSIVLFDFDHFKQVNDRHGHVVGDRALVHTIDAIKSLVRDSDVLARFGGEEFILLLPYTARDGARSLCERILAVVQASKMKVGDNSLTITLSAGSVTCETSKTNLDAMISRADELLYECKMNGRNQCRAATIESGEQPLSQEVSRIAG